jgi:hypothetical protein
MMQGAPGVATEVVRQVSLARLRPSPENDKLYRPVSPDDPDIQALAKSIAEHGVKEPLVVTLDHYILSGHRRYAACKLLDLDEVPCRVEPILSTDPAFLPLLRKYNRQRVKGLDEVFREEALSAGDPEDAYRRLLEHREREAHVDVDTIKIRAASGGLPSPRPRPRS